MMKYGRQGKKCIVLLTVFCVLFCLLLPAGRVYAAENGSTAVELGQAAQKYADVEQFPKSYRESLNALKKVHPNWTFVRMDTGLDWNKALDVEMSGDRSWISNTKPAWMKGAQINSGWSYASREGLAFYMDPRNSLTEDYIFQFEQLTFNEECHSIGALDLFLEKTFMTKTKPAPGTALTFAELFYWLGKAYNVSPYHLASRVYQEQGVNGSSPLISGTYPGFEGYYNYFNIKASGKTNAEVIVNGLTYAKSQNWSSAYFSIEGGAKFVGEKYITKGQYTLYLEKFNVNPKGYYSVYSHQYMQNIMASKSEGLTTKKLYMNAGALNSDFVFVIPVFLNMPEYPCDEPGAAVPAAQPETAVVTSASMNLENAGSIQFTIVPDSAGSVAKITVNGVESAFTQQSDGSVCLSVPVTLRHFEEAKELRLFDAEGKAILFANGGQMRETYTYSVREYLTHVSVYSAVYGQRETRLAKALLTYHDLAAEYFDGIAYTGDLPEADIAGLKTTEPEITVADEAEYVGSSLLIANTIVLRHYFTGLPENAVYNGQPLQKKGDVAYVDAVLIPGELDDIIAVQIYDGTDNIATVSYCPEYYMYQVFTESEDIQLIRLMQGLCNYEMICNEAPME